MSLKKILGKKNLGKKWFWVKKILVQKNFNIKKKFWSENNFGSEGNFTSKKKIFIQKRLFIKKKMLAPKRIWGKKNIGKHRLCAAIRFLVSCIILDFGWLLLVLLVLLVTWFIRTPNPLNSANSPWVVYVSNFSVLVHPLLIDFGWGVILVVVLVTGVKQSQLLV